MTFLIFFETCQFDLTLPHVGHWLLKFKRFNYLVSFALICSGFLRHTSLPLDNINLIAFLLKKKALNSSFSAMSKASDHTNRLGTGSFRRTGF